MRPLVMSINANQAFVKTLLPRSRQQVSVTEKLHFIVNFWSIRVKTRLRLGFKNGSASAHPASAKEILGQAFVLPRLYTYVPNGRAVSSVRELTSK